MHERRKVLEAFDFALRQIQELENSGIEVTQRASYLREDTETVEKYNRDEVLPHEKWIQVSFKVMSKREMQLITAVESKIRQIYGVSFDTGYGSGFRDWELDWSFSVKLQDEKII